MRDCRLRSVAVILFVAVAPTEIEGQGTFAIYFRGGIQHGLWQL